jgi:hypothetical protein
VEVMVENETMLLDIQGKKKESHRICAGKTLKISL